MTHETILLTLEGPKATITFNRPHERHALSPVMMKEMQKALHDLAQNTAVRFLVFKSTGPTFCAGADLYWMKASINLPFEENVDDAKVLGNLLFSIKTFPKPTIAVVEGDVFGGGLGLITACDIILANKGLKMCLSELKLGLIPAMISPYVAAAMGLQAFKAYTLTGEVFLSDDAHHLGFIYKLVEPHAMAETEKNLEAHLLKSGPGASHEAKKLAAHIQHHPLNQELVHSTARWIAKVRESAEGQEGLSAFIAKKQPSWTPS